MHIGSQITETCRRLSRRSKKFCRSCENLQAKYALEFFSIGGGLGIVYQPALASGVGELVEISAAKNILTPQKYADRLLPLLQPLGLKILLEPGRFISGNAGILVTRVEFVKRTGKKNFVIVDAAMNDLIRPAFYDAYHEIVPLVKKSGATISSDVVGPHLRIRRLFLQRPSAAESRRRRFAIALLSAGAYGSVMGSNYNARPLAAGNFGERQKIRRRARTPAGENNLGGRKNRAVAEVIFTSQFARA